MKPILITMLFFFNSLTLWSQGVPGTSSFCSEPQITQTTERDGNSTLGNSYTQTKIGLNFLQTTVRLGQRFIPLGAVQPASVVIAGVPDGAVIEKVFLYSSTSGDGAPVTATVTNPSLASQSYAMTLIGSSADKCWSYAGSHTYRADVTSIFTGNGNYEVSGFPVGYPNDTDGATLMVIYSLATAPYIGNLIINDGASVSVGAQTQTVTFAPAVSNAISARSFIAVADVQLSYDINMDGTIINSSWDWWNFYDVPTVIAAGQTSVSMSSGFTDFSSTDCVNWAIAGVYYTTPCNLVTCYADVDGDGFGDQDVSGSFCETCPSGYVGGGVFDNCINDYNPDQADADCDGVGDVCDLCPGGDDAVDNNNDGFPDCYFPPAYAEILAAWTCPTGGNKVYVAHYNGNGGCETVCVSYNALATHIAHGDYLGPCDNSVCDPEKQPATARTNTNEAINLTVYPNPATDAINIAWHGTSTSGSVLRIYDINGKMVMTTVVPAGLQQFTVHPQKQGFTPGLLFVQIQIEGRTSSQKVVLE